jgi:hypothetical protein
MSLGCDNSGSAGTWTLVAANPPPVAVNESVATKKNTALSIDLTAGASGNPTSTALVGTPANGSVSGFPATTVTFTPTKGFTGAANFQFTLSNAGGTSNTATASIIVGPPPSPEIFANGVNITGSTTTNPALAVVGQPIQLTATPSRQPGQTQVWNGIPQKAIVGGFSGFDRCPNPNPPNDNLPPPLPPCTGTVTALKMSDFQAQTPPLFYWTVPGTYTITYKYALSDGTTSSATATFAVVGPTSPIIDIPAVGALQPIPRGGTSLAYSGITFTASATLPPNSFVGTFLWVQLLKNSTIDESFTDMPNVTCLAGPGLDNSSPALDNTYPFKFGPSTSDAPILKLFPDGVQTKWTFKAVMYLMWQPTNYPSGGSLSGAIPVPIGYVSWGFNGAAKQKNGVWSLGSATSPSPNIKYDSQNYPEWSALVVNGNKLASTTVCN